MFYQCEYLMNRLQTLRDRVAELDKANLDLATESHEKEGEILRLQGIVETQKRVIRCQRDAYARLRDRRPSSGGFSVRTIRARCTCCGHTNNINIPIAR